MVKEVLQSLQETQNAIVYVPVTRCFLYCSASCHVLTILSLPTLSIASRPRDISWGGGA